MWDAGVVKVDEDLGVDSSVHDTGSVADVDVIRLEKGLANHADCVIVSYVAEASDVVMDAFSEHVPAGVRHTTSGAGGPFRVSGMWAYVSHAEGKFLVVEAAIPIAHDGAAFCGGNLFVVDIFAAAGD